jgi:iron complex transport system substrate-binding protein
MKFGIISVIVFLSFLIKSCSGKMENGNYEGKTNNETIISRAGRFSIIKKDSTTLVTIINPWQGAENINLVYHLVKRGSPLPEGLDSSEVIFVPLKKIICMSTTHIAMIVALGEEKSISGVSGPQYVFTDKIVQNIKKGAVADVGYEAGLNKELILSIAPDLVMMYGIGSESAGYVAKIKELGIHVMFNADYLETDPLGKAEWLKLFGALYCKEEIADSIFYSESEAYNSIRIMVDSNYSFRPKVMLGLPYKDTWYISPGNSFISKLIADAGGDYLWKDTDSELSMPYGIENVYLKALDADFWFNIGTIKSRDDITVVDQRLNKLPCFVKGNLFNNNGRITLEGGNDYWESGTVHPHLILEDIAAVLHPELFPDHKLFFYRKIE